MSGLEQRVEQLLAEELERLEAELAAGRRRRLELLSAILRDAYLAHALEHASSASSASSAERLELLGEVMLTAGHARALELELEAAEAQLATLAGALERTGKGTEGEPAMR